MSEDETRDDDARDQMERWDPLSGAEEGDGTTDAFRRAADQVDESLGLREADEEPVPNDDVAADDAMP